MAHVIHLNQSYFHLKQDMKQWCLDNVGNGSNTSTELLPDNWIPPSSMHTDIQWLVAELFGHTTFAFKYEKHLNWFIMKWL